MKYSVLTVQILVNMMLINQQWDVSEALGSLVR